MKKRFVNTRAENYLTKKRFIADSICDENFDADISLIDMIESNTRRCILRDNGRSDCIVDSGFKWLGVYPKGETYAITCMYNEKNELVEFYFDMIKESGVENGIPYNLDIYLDLVITPFNEKYVLDEDELEEALENKMIGTEEYNLAYNTLHKLEEKYKSQKEINKLMDIMQGYLNIMTEKIKDKEIIYTNV